MTSGEKITILRREARMSQETLAERLGISRQAVSKWEAGSTAPSTENLRELSRIFGVSVDQLLEPNEEIPQQEEAPPADSAQENSAPSRARQIGAQLCGKKERALLLLLTLLLGGMGCWLIGQQLQIQELTARVNGLAAQGTQTIYISSREDPTAREVTDYQLRVAGYEPETNAVVLDVTVIPLNFSADTTAKLSVKGALHTTTEDARLEDGALLARLTVPLEEQIKLYLLMEQAGETQTILLEDLSNLMEKYALSGSSDFLGTLALAQGGLSVKGDVSTNLNLSYRASQELNCYPVKGTITLSVDGEVLETKEIEGFKKVSDPAPQDDFAEEAMRNSFALSTAFDRIVPWSYGVSEGNFHTTVVDNFGRTYEFDSSFRF